MKNDLETTVADALATTAGSPALLSWLAADVMLIVAELGDDPDPRVEVTVEDRTIETGMRFLHVPASERGPGDDLTVMTVLVSRTAPGDSVAVSLSSGERELTLGPALAPALGVDLRTTVREALAGQDAATRAQLLEFTAATASEHGDTLDPAGLSKSLFALREALRDAYPRCELRPGETQALHIGAIGRVDERTFFVRGWMHDEQAPIARLDAISPEGGRAQLLESAYRVHRPDLEDMFRGAPEQVWKRGFVSFFELAAPSRLSEGWVFELENTAGLGIEADGPAVVSDPLEVRDMVVAELSRERRFDTPFMDGLVPAVERLQERLADRVEITEVEQLGSAPTDPDVSIVVPLYRRIDLLEHQLAQFADDPQIAASELIFVLDSPELGDELLARVGDLFEVYRVPFKLAVLSRNGGFSVATDRGASLATGRMLLLLNSDVLPAGPGWLERLVAAYDALPEAGAVGPKLLYDDDSIQHAGVEFRRDPASGAWQLTHAFKGLHRDFDRATESHPAPALSGACLLTEASLYRELGGLSADYVKGGYEDADFCMRLHERGLETWYVSEVELYHLEGRSNVPVDNDMSNRFNAWLFNQRWAERIESTDGRQGVRELYGVAAVAGEPSP
jgi:GT2 family glycosyltransferase